jgi:hypothetical protein
MNGHLQLVYGTREGDLFRWNVPGSSALNNSWWHYRHDEWNTGQYGLDTRPPAPVRGLRARRANRHSVRVSLIAPGGDWMVGRASRYQVRASASPISPAGFGSARIKPVAPTPSGPDHRQSFRVSVPARARYLAVRAVDRAGNLGPEVTVRIT